jgi:hypothetical protein
MPDTTPPWQPLFDRVRVIRDGGSVYAPPATDADLDGLETEIGSRLPASYRAWMKRFGPGELQGWISLAKPGPGVKTEYDGVTGLTALHRSFVQEHQEYYPNHVWLSALVYFASPGAGGAYAWEPGTFTEVSRHECRFFYLRRAEEQDPIDAGDSFWKFVEWAEADVDSWRDDPDVEPGLTFTPDQIRLKEKPHHLKVHAWMKWNDRTVRKLALALRTDPRPDEFPVLADALRDAGCDSADLLASCARDAHDEDRAWVLKVLLG